ncbi:MAG: ABC transporter ATP-binding protein [Chloroflexota bacterium]
MEEKEEKQPESHKDLSLWEIIDPVKRQIYGGMAVSAVSSMAWIASLVLILPIGREILSDAPDMGQLWRLWGLMLIAVVIAFVLRTLSFNFAHLGAFRLEKILRTQLTTHLAKVPLGYVISTGSGALKKVLLDDVLSLHTFVADTTPFIARSYATPLVALILMFVVDWRMALLSLAVFPIGMVAMYFGTKDHATERIAYDAAKEQINRAIIEYVQGMQVIRTFDDGTTSFQRYHDALTEATKTERNWARKSQVGGYVSRTLFAALPTLAIITPIGIWWVQRGLIDIPTLIFFVFLAPTVSEAPVNIMWMNMPLNQSKAGVKRIGKLLDVPILPEPARSTPPRNGSVTFKDVSFTYSGRANAALDGVSLRMEPGTVTALVGPSGAGKSTVAQLIPRFWDVNEGAVLVGDVDVREMSSDDLMKQVSFVFQNPYLLHDTVRENIRLGKPKATDAEVEAAAKAAQAHEFILNELPQGYDTLAGDRGSQLSGGQRQRITIARAILQNSPIVILDEATAFADPENEAKIHAGIANLTAGKTLIVVAHRLSTIQDAHQIVVLDKGGVAEIGDHNTLVAADGVYARLWNKFVEAQGWGLRRQEKPPIATTGEVAQ